ncbi:MAG: terminase small subunit [Chloroflexi bacterium]|nr:terminase small subunit [Chloroflexota bacterium]MCI0880912.1 terminase small subunit [Chloroflexota bacterium]
MPNRQKFAEQYALTGNGVQFAIAAGFSARSAHVAASRLLTD